MTTTPRYFGTDGVRGRYGDTLINESFAARLGLAAGRWAGGNGVALLGRDTRASSPALTAALAQGLAAAGLQPVILGVIPTPAVARAVLAHPAVLGVMVTASHNPATDNGIKFFTSAGLKLTEAEELALESQLPAEAPTPPADSLWANPASLPESSHARQNYLVSMTRLLPPGLLTGWRIVVDTAHGATVATTPAVLRALGAKVIPLGDAPDGHNINALVGSEHPQLLATAVRASGARLGIAHDGDGDRVVLCDENGDIVEGDELLTLLALDALRQGQPGASPLVVTVQSNLGVDAALAAAGGRVVRTPVGDRHVAAAMLAHGAALGGESSGHLILADVAHTGDGLAAALRVIQVMTTQGRALSELRRALQKFPQGTRNLVVAARRALADCPTLQAAEQALSNELGAQGRVLVRFSGTEPKLRLLVEGPSAEIVAGGLDQLTRAARLDLDVLST